VGGCSPILVIQFFAIVAEFTDFGVIGLSEPGFNGLGGLILGIWRI